MRNGQNIWWFSDRYDIFLLLSSCPLTDNGVNASRHFVLLRSGYCEDNYSSNCFMRVRTLCATLWSCQGRCETMQVGATPPWFLNKKKHIHHIHFLYLMGISFCGNYRSSRNISWEKKTRSIVVRGREDWAIQKVSYHPTSLISMDHSEMVVLFMKFSRNILFAFPLLLRALYASRMSAVD